MPALLKLAAKVARMMAGTFFRPVSIVLKGCRQILQPTLVDGCPTTA